jgi:hypothetical protein
MAGATNPGNIGHAWVKSLWIDKQPASGMEHPEEFDASDYDFIPARVSDNPIYAGDENYLKTLRALPSHLKRAFLDGDWDVFAGQYFDRFDCSRHVVRAEQIDWKPWWARWISIDWGFEHPAAVYWHAQTPARAARPSREVSGAGGLGGVASAGAACCAPTGVSTTASGGADETLSNDDGRRIVTYREFVTHRTSPRDLAKEIIERSLLSGGEKQIPRTASRAPEDQGQDKSARDFARDDSVVRNGAGREKIDAIYLSPDAFARRTDEASIADQMGDFFVAAGFPRPVPADNDRVGGWMLMYQMLDAGEWLLTENCVELIRTIPNLVRDPARVEDIEKMDGDDPADAARYGLKSRYGARRAWETQPPLEQRVAERVTSTDPTGRAMQAHKFQIEEKRRVQPVSFLHHHRRK